MKKLLNIIINLAILNYNYCNYSVYIYMRASATQIHIEYTPSKMCVYVVKLIMYNLYIEKELNLLRILSY